LRRLLLFLQEWDSTGFLNSLPHLGHVQNPMRLMSEVTFSATRLPWKSIAKRLRNQGFLSTPKVAFRREKPD